MTRQEQLTATTIALFMLALSIYLYIDFYLTGNIYSTDALSGMSQLFNTSHEHVQNINSEITVNVLSQVSK